MFKKLIIFVRDVLDALWAIGGGLFATAWWIGLLFKDRYPLTQLLFFIPPLVMIVFGFFWLYLTLPKRFRLLQLFLFLSVFAAFGKMLLIDFRWTKAREVDRPVIRVVHWNTADGILGTESIVSTLTRDQPHIILISEPPRAKELPAMAHYALGMEHLLMRGTMTLASHFPLENERAIPMVNGQAWAADAYTLQGPLTIVCVDLISHPNLNRKDSMNNLADWLEKNDRYPTIILGDFNTPRDSIAFRPIRKTFHHAYEAAGRGWPYTWPIPLPLYAIDHAWVSSEIETVAYHLMPTRYSDHKRQVMDIDLIPAPPSEPAQKP